MAKKKKANKGRHDKWYWLAKERGFRSRASFKLVQLNKKYDFLSSSHALMDLCAAPGGWLQVAAKYMPVGSLIIGVDLLPIKPIRGVISGQYDITTQRCRNWLKQQSQGWKFDTVIHDGAPNVGGATWNKDSYMQVELVLHSLKLATEFLRPGGSFITKVFRSADYNALLWVLQQFFDKTDVTKPAASRNSSAEIYVACLGYKAPKNVDPRLLDPAHVFKHVEGVDPKEKTVDVFHQRDNIKDRKKAKAIGYDEDARVLYKSASVADFIESKDPIGMLGAYNTFKFDKRAEPYANHEATDQEVRECCKDLRVLGKRDFGYLMKWRQKMMAFRNELMREDEPEEDNEEEDDEPQLSREEQLAQDDERLAVELQQMQEKQRKKAKQQRRKKRERLRRERLRAQLGLNAVDGIGETQEELGFFRLDTVKDADSLRMIRREKQNKDAERAQGSGAEDDDADDSSSSSGSGSDEEEEEEEEEAVLSDILSDIEAEYEASRKPLTEAQRLAAMVSSDSETDSDEDRAQSRLRHMERDIDSMYQQYKERNNIHTKHERLRAQRVGVTEGEVNEDASLEQLAKKVYEEEYVREMSDESDDEMDGSNNPLLVPIVKPEAPSLKSRTSRWFSRDVFADVLGEDGKGAEEPSVPDAGSSLIDTNDLQMSSDSSDADGDEPMDGPAEAPVMRKKAKRRKKGHNDDDDDDDDVEWGSSGKPNVSKQGDFEVVPAQEDFSDYSDDSDARAEVLALGQHLLSKQRRQALEDATYNRYAFGDEDLVPEWFAEDESKHNQKNLPVTKSEVEAFKAQLRAVNARPMRKIAEAKARKKMKAMKRWENLKNKAQAIADQDGLSSNEKLKSIERLYKGSKGKKKRPERTYVVSSKSGGRHQVTKRKAVKGPVKLVDKRMKSDKRAMARAAKFANGKRPRKRKRRRGY